MPKLRVLLLLGVLGYSLIACTKVAYYKGSAYPPTDQVEVFGSVIEIGMEHHIFGEMQIEGKLKARFSQLRGRAIDEAKARGADAIVIGQVDEKGNYTYGFYHPGSISAKSLLVFFVKYGPKPQPEESESLTEEAPEGPF